ncbi:MAG: glycoside hydrolase family 78 protein [Phycisphaerae bacterium]
MLTQTIVIVFLAGCLATNAFAQTASATQDGLSAPRNLRCEYLTDPLGIDETLPRLSWEMVDSRRGAVQRAYRILVTDDLTLLNAHTGNLWDTGKVASDQSNQVVYDGKPLRSRTRVYWKVRVWDQDDRPSAWSSIARWSMGLLAPSDWEARWIRDSGTLETSDRSEGRSALPAPMLRREFSLPDAASIRRATVYVTALGLYELRINGRRVGGHILAPEWTDYHKRVQYQTYDVTDLLRPGENAVAALLGDGWYAGRIGLAGIVPGGPIRGIYGRQPRLLLRLEVELSEPTEPRAQASGRVQIIVSDGSWRATTDGPIRVSDLLDGEVYDARRVMPGWDAPGFDDSSWRPVRVFDRIDARLVAQPNEPIRIVKELKPVALTQPEPGVHVFDLGQNMVGWSRVKLRGPAGTTVTLRHAEVLNPDGTIYRANLRSAAQTDRYTLRGDGEEVFEPHFTYHGFRYVEVTGLPYKPSLDALVGCVFHSSAKSTGRFECSSPLLNQLMRNIVWTQRANLMSVPTDCPQRDERLGWMGDILAFAQTACFNMDMAAFFTKWLPDVRDAQTDDGRYPDFAPHPYDPAERFSSAPAWGDAGVVVPWRAYVNYADTRILAQHFDSAKAWIDHIRHKNPDLLWKNGRGNDYGDWLNADTLRLEGWPSSGAAVPKEVLATAFFAHSTELLSKMAAVIGREDDAQRYAALADDIKAAFNRAYVAPDGRIQGNTQAGYALALNFNLLPDSLRAAAARYMLEAFETYRGHISTGFHSTICLMQELSRNGYNDEAYRLINNRTMPSWGYAIEHGATTIWERWDGYVEGRGFQDAGMNSFSHYALGSVGEWMFRTIAGINPDEDSPGYKHFIVRPQPGGGLTWARGEYDSIHGRIVSSWKVEGTSLALEVVIPANTTATVYVPAADVDAVEESGQPAEKAEGVQFLRMDGGAAVYRVASGNYRFSVRDTGKAK